MHSLHEQNVRSPSPKWRISSRLQIKIDLKIEIEIFARSVAGGNAFDLCLYEEMILIN